MYQVLYRKWRPKTFDDVAGQEHITTTLKNELMSNRLNHAYLFTGSRGTGKTSCAKILAKAVNCLDLQNGNPCGKCEACRGIDDGSILDIVEMDAASNRNIDDIRSVIEEVQFKPAKTRYRVYIVDEVHMLTQFAFNALLKTLEEPPEHAVFILATTEVHKLPQTILSRCQRFDFHRIPPQDIANRLMFVARQEDVEISESAALLIASVADGALRDALSLLDRCVAISSDIDDEVVRNCAGLARKTYLFDLATCVINKNTSKALEIIDSLYSESKDMARLCDELLMHFRSLLLIKSVRNPRDILIMTDDEFENAQTQSDYLSLADIVYYMEVLSTAYQRMGKGTGDRTELEMALVKLSSSQLDGTVEALTARITALEKTVKSVVANRVEPLHNQSSVQSVAVSQPAQNIAESNEQSDKTIEPLNQNTAQIFENTSENPINKAESKKSEPENNYQAVSSQATNNYQDTLSQLPAITSDTQEHRKTASAADIEELYKNAKPFPQWIEVVGNMKSISRAISAAFAGSSAYESAGYLLIDTNNEMAFELLKKGSRREEIRRVILETTGRVYKLGPYKKPKQEVLEADPLDAFKNGLIGTDVQITES